MKFRNLNNENTLIESEEIKMLFDPRVAGNLYQNSWIPYPKQEILSSWFSEISHVFISHLHQDHWDLDTVKLLNRDAKILIPKLKFNEVIRVSLSNLGFSDINFIELETWIKLSASTSIFIIPPLNGMAQDYDLYDELSSSRPTAIDTGIIIKDEISNTTHIILVYNSHYDIDLAKRYFEGIECSTLWFPYNGFAMDYPICYDNLTIQEKQKISLEMSLKREDATLRLLKIFRPKYLIPHSSDFLLNGPRKEEFFLIHNNEFLDKSKYSNRIEKITGIKSLPLYGKDCIVFNKDGSAEVKIESTPEDRIRTNDTEINLEFPNADFSKVLLDEVNEALSSLFARVDRFNLNINGVLDWVFIVEIENAHYTIDFEKREISTIKNNSNKYKLILITSENIFRCLLQRKLHWNNAEIGQYLTWQRYPDVFCKNLYDCLNFFHT